MKRLHLICNAHLDPVWQWTWDEGIAAAIATFKSAADLAEEFDYVFCHNEALLYEAVEKHAPELFERIKCLVENGKWKITGGWYLQPDCNMPSGESIVRQIYYGRKYFKEKFGVEPDIAANYDSFGHSIGLVQILKKNGYRGYIFTRPSDSVAEYPGRFFNWTGPDGSTITACRVPFYGTGMGHAAAAVRERIEKAEQDIDIMLWGVGNHGGGPSRKDLSEIESIEGFGETVVHSCLEDAFSDDIVISGEMKCSLERSMPGCYTSMMKIKRAHRQTENLLYSTEKLLAVAGLCGYKPDMNMLEEAQKRLLLAEFHDILPGTSVPEGEAEGLELLGTASKIIKDYRTGALMYLVMGDRPAKAGEYPVFVFNSAPYSVACPVEAELSLSDQNWDDGFVYTPEVYCGDTLLESQIIKERPTLNLDWRKRICFNAELKPLGITRFTVKFRKEEKVKKEYQNVSAEKILSTGKVLKKPVKLVMYDDSADPWAMSDDESLHLGRNPVDFELMTEEEAEAFCQAPGLLPEHVTEDGKIFTCIEQLVKSGNSRGVIAYRIYKNEPFVDLKVTLEFADKNKLVRLSVPCPSGEFIGDGPYVVEKKGSTEIPFQKWIGIENGSTVFSVINDGVYGGRLSDGRIELTLVRGAGYLFHPIGDRQLYPTDRYLPRIDCGRYEYNFRIFSGSVSEVCLQAQLFNEGLYSVNAFPIGTGKKEGRIYTDIPVLMPVCKPYKNGSLFRFYNPGKKEQSFNLTVSGTTGRIEVLHDEVVSAVFDGENIKVIKDKMPV